MYLDKNGVYWPKHVSSENRLLPKAEACLRITDTWVLFARPRSNISYIQDLEVFKNIIDDEFDVYNLPAPVKALVNEPADTNLDIELTNYRGLSNSFGGSSYFNNSLKKEDITKDIFFPLAYNDEQIRIVQYLDTHDCVIVQGPPGTGKTHTIANVICHYLANGKRVLVTSMREPALTVLREKLPTEIRSLAISLLTSEDNGTKQLEYAISTIAAEVQRIDRVDLAKQINNLENQIDCLHRQLALTDKQVSEWAKKKLTLITIDEATIEPQMAAKEIVKFKGQFEWIPDNLTIETQYEPQFSDENIVQLRQARQILGENIIYLNQSLPLLNEFPEAALMFQAHLDLSKLSTLSNEIVIGNIPYLVNSGTEATFAIQELKNSIVDFRNYQKQDVNTEKIKTTDWLEQIHNPDKADLFLLLKKLGCELKQANDEHKTFINRPVTLPEDCDFDPTLLKAIQNFAKGKRPFGLSDFLGKNEARKKLNTIRIMGCYPNSNHDWAHVLRYVQLQTRLRQLAMRWNAIANELYMNVLPGANPEHGLQACKWFSIYEKIRSKIVLEKLMIEQVNTLLPSWQPNGDLLKNKQTMDELENILQFHLHIHHLMSALKIKEKTLKILEAHNGPIIEAIKKFINEDLGHSEISDSEIQSAWSSLTAALSHILSLNDHFLTIIKVTKLIENSGAPKLAELLRQPAVATTNTLLPSNWRAAWRLKRLATHLAEIDAQNELQALSNQRHDLEKDLAKAYQTIVSQRTWLKLTENATSSVRSALMAYLNAIRKIGKGTGKRVIRYRQNARIAADQASQAIPCWIMPHYRVHESLPSKSGYFDLVIIDEASQSDLSALPAILRA